MLKTDRPHTDPSEFIAYRPRGLRASITAKQIWDEVKQGHSRNTIRRKFRGVTGKHIDIAESFYLENDRAEYERVFGPPATDFVVWVDECVQWRHATTLHKAGYGQIYTIVGQGLNTTKDPVLWRELWANDADLIITRDGKDVEPQKTDPNEIQHLCTLARHERKPHLLKDLRTEHVPGFPHIVVVDHGVKNRDLYKLLQKHASHIIQRVKKRRKHVLSRLGPQGIHKDLTTENMVESALNDPIDQAISQLEKEIKLPFDMRESFNAATKYVAASNIDPEKARDEILKNENARQYYHEEKQSLKAAVIAYAKAQKRWVDIDLVRAVLLMEYGPDALDQKRTLRHTPRLSQADPSPEPSRSQAGTSLPHHAYSK